MPDDDPHGLTSRRSVLKGATALGAGLVGAGVATPVTAASDSRFILLAGGSDVSDSDRRAVEDAGMTIDAILDEVGIIIARGTATEAKKTGLTYGPDIELGYELPDHHLKENDTSTSDSGCYDLHVDDEYLRSLKWDTDAHRTDRAHETTTGEDVRVAVIDSGVDAKHPDLDVNVELSQHFTTDTCGPGRAVAGSHGTHVAGIVGANGPGVYGQAPDAEIIDCRVFPAAGKWGCSGDTDFQDDQLDFKIPPGSSLGNVTQAIVHATNVGSDVANMSLSIGHFNDRDGMGDFYGKVWARVCAYANSNDTLLVSSAGNSNANLQAGDGTISTITEAPNVMTVAATGPLGYKWDAGTSKPAYTPATYSNDGKNVLDVGAGGGNFPFDDDVPADGWYWNERWGRDLVLSTVPHYYTREDLYNECEPLFPMYFHEDDSDKVYRHKAGTSMSSPQVAGIAALGYAALDDPSAREVRGLIESTARDVPVDRFHIGSGFADAANVVESARSK